MHVFFSFFLLDIINDAGMETPSLSFLEGYGIELHLLLLLKQQSSHRGLSLADSLAPVTTYVGSSIKYIIKCSSWVTPRVYDFCSHINGCEINIKEKERGCACTVICAFCFMIFGDYFQI